jgi:hypothetical protein
MFRGQCAVDVVESDIADSGRLRDTAPGPPQVVGLHRSTQLRREDQAVILPGHPGGCALRGLALGVIAQRLDADRR